MYRGEIDIGLIGSVVTLFITKFALIVTVAGGEGFVGLAEAWRWLVVRGAAGRESKL